MMPNREGCFHAYPQQIGVDETGPNNLATVMIHFVIVEEVVEGADGSPFDIADEGLEITGWFYLEKVDGSLNTTTIDMLKESLGWDGRDPFWLQDADLGEVAVQITLRAEEYEGRTRMRVGFLNPYGSPPRSPVSKAEGSARQGLAGRLVGKLAAHAGGTPANAPRPAKAGPTPPPKRAASPPPSRPTPGLPPTAIEATQEEAWAAFVEACPDDWAQQRIELEWFTILAGLFPGKTPDDLIPLEWGRVKTEAPRKLLADQIPI